jgi:hypothetical protein
MLIALNIIGELTVQIIKQNIVPFFRDKPSNIFSKKSDPFDQRVKDEPAKNYPTKNPQYCHGYPLYRSNKTDHQLYMSTSNDCQS